jgi:hypothetical protein
VSVLDELNESHDQKASDIQASETIAEPTFSRIEAVGVMWPSSRYTTATTIMAREALTRK